MRSELDRIAEEAARALQVESARIELGAGRGEGDDSYPLEAGDRRVGTIYLERPRAGSAASRRHLLPALASLLGIAIDRERLAGEALEAEALRRSDAMKTAVLRAVSHDLRTPLMAILTSASALAREDLELGREDRSQLSRTILAEAERLNRLVGNLLDLSRLQAGAAQPAPDVWTVDDLVVQALDELGRRGKPRRGRSARRVARSPGRRTPDPERPREPDGERAQVLVGHRGHARDDHSVRGTDPRRRPRRGCPSPRSRADLRAVPAGLERDRRRRGARPRDRPRLRRGERRPRLGRVASGPGRHVRPRAAGDRAEDAT